MAEETVRAFDRDGNRILVPASKVAELEELGGRVATEQDVAAVRAEETYAQKSLAEKALGVAQMAGPVMAVGIGAAKAAYNKATGSSVNLAPDLPPGLEAYKEGLSRGIGGGLPTVAVQKALEVTAGKEAARAYGQNALAAAKAHEGLYQAGEVTGLIGGAVAGGPITRVGNVAEAAAARSLGGLASRGALGRAALAAGELGARGAAEGALYGAANQITEDSLGDREIVADKLLAATGLGALYGGLGGALLGGGGSLAKSGAGAAVGSVRGSLSRAAGKAEQAVNDLGAKTADDGLEAIGKATGTSGAQERAAAKGLLGDLQTIEGQKGLAYDRAWSSIGKGFGLQSTGYAAKAAKFLPNGTRDIGEVMMRKGIINAEGGLMSAAKMGTPAELLPRIEAELAPIGQRLGEITEASGGRVSFRQIDEIFDEVLNAPRGGKPALAKTSGMEPTVKGIRQYRESLMRNLGFEDAIPKMNDAEAYSFVQQMRSAGLTDDQILSGVRDEAMSKTISLQDVLAQRKGLDDVIWREGSPLNASPRVEELRSVRTKVEALITDALDKSSGKVSGELAAEYKALKKDFMALSLAQSAARDSATRMAKGSTFGLLDTLRGGGNPALMMASKVVRERGDAAAAVLLYRMADMGTLTKMVSGVDELIGRAARGVTEAPKPAPTGAAVGNYRVAAQREAMELSKLASNPERVAEAVAKATEPMAQSAPNLSQALGRRLTDALAFAAAAAPKPKDPDPFDPHPAPKMSDAEAFSYVQKMRYVKRPELFFEEAAAGKITYEGVEVARALMPGAFAEMQQRTAEALADMIAAGSAPPYRQRERLGLLLDIPAVPAQRPDHVRFLQQIAVQSTQSPEPQGAPAKGPNGPKRPLSSPTQQNPLDRLEDKKR